MENDNDTNMMQLFLRVDGDECPRLVMQPVKNDSYSANLVLLPGCVIKSKYEFDEDDAWKACTAVSDQCREGQLISTRRDEMCGNLFDALSVLDDLMLIMSEEANVGCKTVHAIAARVRELLVKAGECIDIDLESEKEG